jgi:hypothetical protein
MAQNGIVRPVSYRIPLHTSNVSGLPQPSKPVLASGAAVAPSSAVHPPAAVLPPNSGLCPSIYDLRLRVFSSGNPQAGRSLALSDTPAASKYWRVLQIDAIDSDISAVRPIGFFLTPPGLQLAAGPVNTNLPNVLPFLVNTISLGVGQGDSNASDTQTIAAGQGGWAAPTSMLPIFVPSGWQLGAVDLISAVNANPVQLLLRVLYVELSTDVPLSF